MDLSEWLAPLHEHGLVPDDCLAAYVVGSAARGWLNDRSDFDVYIVSESGWESPTSQTTSMPLNPPIIKSEIFIADRRRWEVTYWRDAQIEQMLSKVSWERYDSDVMAGGVLTPREEVSLARIVDCIPLLGEDWILERRRKFRESAFQSFVVARSLEAADGSTEDALGQLEFGMINSAVISARRAFEHAVDALLESSGEFGSQIVKWRPNRFQAIEQDLLSFDEYWGYETMRDFDENAPEDWIRSVLSVCQQIAMSVETR